MNGCLHWHVLDRYVIFTLQIFLHAPRFPLNDNLLAYASRIFCMKWFLPVVLMRTLLKASLKMVTLYDKSNLYVFVALSLSVFSSCYDAFLWEDRGPLKPSNTAELSRAEHITSCKGETKK